MCLYEVDASWWDVLSLSLSLSKKKKKEVLLGPFVPFSINFPRQVKTQRCGHRSQPRPSELELLWQAGVAADGTETES